MKLQFKHVLVATDFGEPAQHALERAIALAKQADGKVTLLHVFHIARPAYDVLVELPIAELAGKGRSALQTALAHAKQRYPRCESVFETGEPARRIVETAVQLGADLIVVGTHGRRGLPRMLLGSVAEKVVRTSPVPVLIVPQHESPDEADVRKRAAKA
jgi:nucleotide-binding universal stress UspA family protein